MHICVTQLRWVNSVARLIGSGAKFSEKNVYCCWLKCWIIHRTALLKPCSYAATWVLIIYNPSYSVITAFPLHSGKESSSTHSTDGKHYEYNTTPSNVPLTPFLAYQKLDAAAMTKMRKINGPWPKSSHFFRWSGYIIMSYLSPFLLRICTKMLENHEFDLFHYVKMPPKWNKSTDHDKSEISSKGGHDTSACQI